MYVFRNNNAGAILFFRRDGKDASGQAGSAFDARPGGKQQRSRRSHLIQIIQHLDLNFALAQHITLAGQISGGGSSGAGVRI